MVPIFFHTKFRKVSLSMKKPSFDKCHIKHSPKDEELEGIDFAWFEIEYLFIRWMLERDRRKNAHKGQA